MLGASPPADPGARERWAPRPLRPRAAGRAGGGGRGRPADAVRARSDSTSAHDAKRKGLGLMSGLSRREFLEYGAVAVLGAGLGRGLTGYDPAPESSDRTRSEEHTSELQSRQYLVCRLLLEKKIQLSSHVN